MNGGSRQPWRKIFPSFLMFTVLEVNLTVHPASQKFLIETRECRASPGNMYPARACVGNWSSWSWHSCVSHMASPLDMPTTIGGDPVLHGLCGALGYKTFPLAPVSATPVRMVFVGGRCCASLTSSSIFRLPTCTAPMSQSLGLFHIFLLVCWFLSHHRNSPVACLHM